MNLAEMMCGICTPKTIKLLKTVKEQVNKSRDIPHSQVEILNIVEMPVLPGSSLTIQFQSNMNGPRPAKAVLRKKSKFGRLTLPD